MWPPSPVTHAGSVRNLCLKMLNVKKGRAEAGSTTEIGLWRQRRSKSSFCTKLSAKDPKTWVGERGGRGLHAMPCIHPAEPLQLLLDPEPGKNPKPRRWVPEPRLPRVILRIGLPHDVRGDSTYWLLIRPAVPRRWSISVGPEVLLRHLHDGATHQRASNTPADASPNPHLPQMPVSSVEGPPPWILRCLPGNLS